MANRSPRVADGLSARALVGYIKEVGGELVAGTSRFQTVLIVCEVEAPLVDDGEIEVVGEDLTEEDHPIDAFRCGSGRVCRIACLSAYTRPALVKPSTMVVLLEPVADPGDEFGREPARGLVDLQASAVGGHLTGESRLLDLRTSIAELLDVVDREADVGAWGRDPVTASTDHGTGISLKREKIVGAEEIAGIS